MDSDYETGRYFLPSLIAGFALLLLLLLVSGWVAIDSMRFMESDASRLFAEQHATARLIDEAHSEEGNLSSVFYSLAARQDIDRTVLLKRLDALESAIRRTTDTGAASNNSQLWSKVRRAADLFIEEGRSIIRSGRPPSDEFYQRHQNLLGALADLAGSSFSPNSDFQAETERLSSRIHYFVVLLAIAALMAILGALFTVYFVNRMFRRQRWQASELTHLSSRTMSDQEETASRLSREMHDHFGQTLSAIEANLVAMRHARVFHAGRIEDCLGLVKDAVENVREVSQLLRPPILDDFGLDASLRWLADSFAERTGKEVQYESFSPGRLHRTVETQLFRIAQEALTNVARHSGATQVRIELTQSSNALCLAISDNGKGMSAGSEGRGIGLVGMRARARAAAGTLSVSSRPGKGVRICAEVPMQVPEYVPENSHSVSR
jgi:signal transduction histidine kinase